MSKDNNQKDIKIAELRSLIAQMVKDKKAVDNELERKNIEIAALKAKIARMENERIIPSIPERYPDPWVPNTPNPWVPNPYIPTKKIYPWNKPEDGYYGKMPPDFFPTFNSHVSVT